MTWSVYTQNHKGMASICSITWFFLQSFLQNFAGHGLTTLFPLNFQSFIILFSVCFTTKTIMTLNITRKKRAAQSLCVCVCVCTFHCLRNVLNKINVMRIKKSMTKNVTRYFYAGKSKSEMDVQPQSPLESISTKAIIEIGWL